MESRVFRVPYSAWDVMAGVFIAGTLACLLGWAIDYGDSHSVVLIAVTSVTLLIATVYEHRVLPPKDPNPRHRLLNVMFGGFGVVVCLVVIFYVENPWLVGAAVWALLAIPAFIAAISLGPQPDRDVMRKGPERLLHWIPIIVAPVIGFFFIDDGIKKHKKSHGEQKIEVVKPAANRE